MNKRVTLYGFGEPIHGRKMQSWKGKGAAPGMERKKEGWGSYWDWKGGHHPSWVDHHYRLKADSGDEFYVSEPYGLGNTAIAELATLVSEGWHVMVSADSGYGHGTVRVVVESKEQCRRRCERQTAELLAKQRAAG